jgi:hypothetical protein
MQLGRPIHAIGHERYNLYPETLPMKVTHVSWRPIPAIGPKNMGTICFV